MPESRDFHVRLGARLRSIRKQRGLSLGDVEKSTGGEFKASVVGAYERGERAISVPRLAKLAECYAVTIEELLPPEDDRKQSRERQSSAVRSITIDIEELESATGSEARIIERYVNRIRMDRGAFDESKITIRREDIRTIAAFLDTEEQDLVRYLEEMGVVAGRASTPSPAHM